MQLNVKKWVKRHEKEGDNMFSGEFDHSIDIKGRVTIPSKFREELGDTCVVTRGFDGCLEICSPSRWEEHVELLLSSTKQAENFRRLKRQIFSKSITCDYDKQGRILISQELRTLAKLTDKVMVVGIGDHIELWDLESWTDYNEMDNAEFNVLGEEVFNGI